MASLVAYESGESSGDDDQRNVKQPDSEENTLHLKIDPSSFQQLVHSTAANSAPMVTSKVKPLLFSWSLSLASYLYQ